MIKIQNLEKSFENKTILKGINFNINDGETLCIIGKSGCGKSVLLKHIVGLLAPDVGKVLVDEQEIALLNQKQLFTVRKKIGYVFQGAALFDSYNVFENVVLKLAEHGEKDKNILKKNAQKVLSSVGLLPEIEQIHSKEFEKEWQILSQKKPSELSGGMRKRVGVARSLIGEPKYIFYDEPTTGLDPVTSKQIDDLIADLSKKLKITSVVITHDMFSVYDIADKIAMLHDGNLQFYGTVDEIKNSSDNVIIEFLKRYC